MTNKLMLTLGAIILILALAGCGSKQEGQTDNTGQQSQQVAQTEQTATAAINLPTMKCEMCAKTITEAVQQLDGVKAVNVSVEKKNTEVQFITAKLDVKKIEDAIAKAGYDANNTKRSEEAYSKLPKCCQ
jgi:copper ion binding protein